MYSIIAKPLSVQASDMNSAGRRGYNKPCSNKQGIQFSGLLRPLAKALCIVTLACAPAVYAAKSSSQALSVPAEMSPLAQHSLLLDAANAGSRLVAVGQFGHILYSDDEGASWTQAQVPVSSTLTALYFVDEQYGWAVGHEGVVLATTDGGHSWQQQLNGLEINKLGLDLAQTLLTYPAEHDGEVPAGIHPDLSAEDFEMLEMDAADFYAEGASRPLMDVWFKNKNEGLIVGAYGLILRTIDGGNSWTPGFDKLYNIDNFHYYGIVPAPTQQHPDALILIGEAGLLHRSLDSGLTWEALESPYEGSFFGGLYNPASNDLLVYGLRGNLYRSSDLGTTWQTLDSNTTASIFDGDVLADGSMLLVGSAGLQMTLDSATLAAKPDFSPRRTPYSAVTVSPSGKVLLAGLRGIELISDQESH
ncbi:MAG: YCF48-related protein [Amphritea sp.]